MHANSPSAFSLSIAIHALVVGVAVALTLMVARHREIRPIDFEWVDDKDIEIGDHFEMPGPPSPNPGIKIKPMNARLRPAPPPSPVVPVRDLPSKTVSKPPVPSPKTPSKKPPTSYAEFQKQNEKQLQQNSKISREPRSKPAPGIDTKGILDDLQKSVRGPRGDSAGTNGTRMMIPALDAYWARLIRALKAAYDQPDSVGDLLMARVSFFLAPDGSISAVRIVKPSGDPAYDRSVIDAFHQVRSIGAVPGGKSGTFEINFKMTE